MGGMTLTADLSNLGGFIGAMEGFITAIQDPRTEGEFLDNLMQETKKEFYVDSRTAMESGAANIKHVYEWGDKQGEVGVERLFNLLSAGRDNQKYMTFEFLPSNKFVPLPDATSYGFPETSKKGKTLSRHIFRMKALVMETQSSVLIKPKRAKKLFIPDATKSKGFFMAPAARVNPGGPQATGGFAKWWSQWFESRAGEIARIESKKAEELIAATGQKVIRYAAGTKINGISVGGRFATGEAVSFGNINAARATAEMQSRNTFKMAWDKKNKQWKESY